LIPLFLRTYGIAKAGPIPITSGGTPATEYPTTLAKMGSPKLLATDLLTSKTAAAPSVT